MTIKRNLISEPISGNIRKKEIPVYCPRCNFGRLQPRVYKEEELVAGQLPVDQHLWKQCYHCGNIVAVYDIPQQGELTTDIETIDTKASIPKPDPIKPRHRRGFNERLDRKDDIKDPEVKAALKKGAKLLSYSER